MYVVWPAAWEMIALATPEVQESVSAPPTLELAIVRSYDGEISVKLPPVELDRVTMTFVAFTWRASATEPVAIVKVVAGELRDMVSAVL